MNTKPPFARPKLPVFPPWWLVVAAVLVWTLVALAVNELVVANQKTECRPGVHEIARPAQ